MESKIISKTLLNIFPNHQLISFKQAEEKHYMLLDNTTNSAEYYIRIENNLTTDKLAQAVTNWMNIYSTIEKEGKKLILIVSPQHYKRVKRLVKAWRIEASLFSYAA